MTRATTTVDMPMPDLPPIRVTPDGLLGATVSVPYRGPRDLALLYRLAAVAVIILGDEGLLDLTAPPVVRVHRGAGKPLAAAVTISGNGDTTPDGAILRIAERAALLAARGPTGILEYRVDVKRPGIA